VGRFDSISAAPPALPGINAPTTLSDSGGGRPAPKHPVTSQGGWGRSQFRGASRRRGPTKSAGRVSGGTHRAPMLHEPAISHQENITGGEAKARRASRWNHGHRTTRSAGGRPWPSHGPLQQLRFIKIRRVKVKIQTKPSLIAHMKSKTWAWRRRGKVIPADPWKKLLVLAALWNACVRKKVRRVIGAARFTAAGAQAKPPGPGR
jgi:hypothetical protein